LAEPNSISGKTLKGQYLTIYDYYFVDSGILKVTVMPWPSIVLTVGLGLILGAILLSSWIGGLIFGFIFYLLTVPVAKRRRARLGALSFQQLAASKNSTLIPWPAVENVKLGPKAMAFKVGKRVLRVEHFSDFGGIAALCKSKLGDRASEFPSRAAKSS
jgi:hypothetical protein